MDSLISLPLVDETDMPTTAVPSSSTVQDYQVHGTSFYLAHFFSLCIKFTIIYYLNMCISETA